ncbi:MAG: 3-oxoacyl-ACP reductase family protein [Candidatus Diapherotrites archaeon]
MKFQDKVVLVTGSSRGIGKATALAFGREGAKVVVNFFKSEKEANEVVREIEKSGGQAIAIQCDVSNEEQVKQMFDKAVQEFGRIDVLVNNAGIVFDLPFEERTVEHWKKTLEVNLIGTFLCTRKAAQLMKKSGGAIVNLSSTNAFQTTGSDSVDYDASKAGIVILTKDMAKGLAPNIRVNAVAPGWVDTDMNKKLPKDFIRTETQRVYVKRFARPEEIANAILFLASEEASFVNGSTLVIDGGYD